MILLPQLVKTELYPYSPYHAIIVQEFGMQNISFAISTSFSLAKEPSAKAKLEMVQKFKAADAGLKDDRPSRLTSSVCNELDDLVDDIEGCIASKKSNFFE